MIPNIVRDTRYEQSEKRTSAEQMHVSEDDEMIYEKLVSIMTDRLEVSPQDISPDTLFKEDLAVDSLDLYDLVMALEEEFNVEMPADRLNDVEVVSDVIRILKELGVED